MKNHTWVKYMRGEDHTTITAATFFPFLLPAILDRGIDVILPLIFFISAIIGSLTPDADCDEKSALYYRCEIVYVLMKLVIIKPIILFFQKIISRKFNLEHVVRQEHRGIIHSPIGIFMSSFLLSIIVLIFMLFFKAVNVWVLLTIFSGLLFGQLMHLLEDSCTVLGINWKFPFGTKVLKGKIHTSRKDARLIILYLALMGLSAVLFFSYKNIEQMNLPLWGLSSIILFCVVFIWAVMLFVSKCFMFKKGGMMLYSF